MNKTKKAATGTTKKAASGVNSASCISDGGLAPWSRGTLTPDQVCARDFNPKLTGGEPRVAYKCTSGANWACCVYDEVGDTTEQPLQNLGTCTRYADTTTGTTTPVSADEDEQEDKDHESASLEAYAQEETRDADADDFETVRFYLYDIMISISQCMQTFHAPNEAYYMNIINACLLSLMYHQLIWSMVDDSCTHNW